MMTKISLVLLLLGSGLVEAGRQPPPPHLLQHVLDAYTHQYRAQTNFDAAQLEWEEAEAALDQFRTECDGTLTQLRVEIDRLKVESDQLQQSRTVVQSQARRCESDLRQLRRRRDIPADEIARKEAECRALNDQLNTLITRLNDLKTRRNQLKQERDQKKDECAARIREMEGEVGLIKQSFEQAEEMLGFAMRQVEIALSRAARKDICGNDLCMPSERESGSCPADCGTSPVECGDGICLLTEFFICTPDCINRDWSLVCRNARCFSTSPSETCGNGRLESENGGEQCEDGNTTSGDGCSNLCQLECITHCVPVCGDGIITVREECDDGNTASGDGCTSECERGPITCYACSPPLESCMEVLVAASSCSDPLYDSSSSCMADCNPPPVCGDGVVDPGEGCDNGDANSDTTPNACRADCTIATCGDGVTDDALREGCDDENAIDGDGCRNDCTLPPPPTATCFFCGASDRCSSITTDPAICSIMFSTAAACEAECGDRPVVETTCYSCGPGGCAPFTSISGGCEEAFADSASCEAFCPDAPRPTITCYSCNPESGCVPSTVEGEFCPEFTTADPATCEASCTSDVEACKLETEDLPEGFRVNEVPEEEDPSQIVRFVSNCTSDTMVRYRICAPDGSITVNEIPCGGRCEEGACLIEGGGPTCTETDDGDDPDNFGATTMTSASGEASTRDDVCLTGGFTVYEYFCREDGTRTAIVRDCRSRGGHCEEGECVPGLIPGPTCTETDDGDDPDHFGTTTTTFTSSGIRTSADFCLDDGVTVYEWFCREDGTSAVSPQDCRRRGGHCEGGECVPGRLDPTCTETDDGDDPDHFGATTMTSASGETSTTRTDSCLEDGVTVYEWFCREDGTRSVTTWDCRPRGGHCEGGECVSTDCSCRRTDATAAEAGFVRYHNGTSCVQLFDVCEDAGHIRQVSCNADGQPLTSDPIACSGGCVDGRCL